MGSPIMLAQGRCFLQGYAVTLPGMKDRMPDGIPARLRGVGLRRAREPAVFPGILLFT